MSSISEGTFGWTDALCHDPLPVGGIAIALMLGTYALLRIPVSLPLLAAGGCGAALVYGLDRGVVRSPEDEVNHPERQRWMRTHWGRLAGELLVLLVVGSVATAFLKRRTLVGAVVLAAVTSLHLLPVGSSGRPLKALGVGKPLAVAGAWAVGSALLPVLEADAPIDGRVGALVAYRLFFLLPNVLLADWADRAGDAAAGLRTWTQAWTHRRLRTGATALLAFALAGGAAVWYGGSPLSLLLIDALGLVLMAGAVWTLHPGVSPLHRFLLDAVVAWPAVPWLVAALTC